MKRVIGLLILLLTSSVSAETVQEYQDRMRTRRDSVIKEMVDMERIPCKELKYVSYPKRNTWTFQCDGKDYVLLRTRDDFVILENPSNGVTPDR